MNPKAGGKGRADGQREDLSPQGPAVLPNGGNTDREAVRPGEPATQRCPRAGDAGGGRFGAAAPSSAGRAAASVPGPAGRRAQSAGGAGGGAERPGHVRNAGSGAMLPTLTAAAVPSQARLPAPLAAPRGSCRLCEPRACALSRGSCCCVSPAPAHVTWLLPLSAPRLRTMSRGSCRCVSPLPLRAVTWLLLLCEPRACALRHVAPRFVSGLLVAVLQFRLDLYLGICSCYIFQISTGICFLEEKVTEVENSLQGFKGRFKQKAEKLSKLEDRTSEMIVSLKNKKD